MKFVFINIATVAAIFSILPCPSSSPCLLQWAHVCWMTTLMVCLSLVLYLSSNSFVSTCVALGSVLYNSEQSVSMTTYDGKQTILLLYVQVLPFPITGVSLVMVRLMGHRSAILGPQDTCMMPQNNWPPSMVIGKNAYLLFSMFYQFPEHILFELNLDRFGKLKLDCITCDVSIPNQLPCKFFKFCMWVNLTHVCFSSDPFSICYCIWTHHINS